MPPSIQQQDLTNSLIELKTQYEQALTEAQTNANHLRGQLSHVNALLLNQLLPAKVQIKSAEPALTLEEADAQVERLVLAPSPTIAESPASSTPETKASLRKAKAEPQPAPRGRTSRELLPAYRGLKRLDAIAQVLAASPGEEITADSIVETLFGNLNVAEYRAERKRLNALLYQGIAKGLWQKASAPSSYLIEALAASTKPKRPGRKTEPSKEPKPEPVAEVETVIAPAEIPVVAAKPRTSLTLLPAFEGLSKRNAIAKVLGQYLGKALHQDTIIQMLYGDLSIADLKAERSRMDTALRTGVKDQKWQKASVPASYVLEAPAEASVAEATVAKPKSAKTKAKVSKKKVRPKRSEAELLEILQKADIQI